MSYTEIGRLAGDLRAASLTARTKGNAIVRKAAFDVQAYAQAVVPVDTGATKNSIGVDTSFVGTSIAAVVGPTTFYAPFLEHGTRFMAPRPFMGPALARVEPGFVQALEALGGSIL